MIDYYLDIRGGLGNQLYILSYADYLKRELGIRVKLLNDVGAYVKDIGGGGDRSRRDLFIDLVGSLDIPIVKYDLLSRLFCYKWRRYFFDVHEEESLRHGIFLGKRLPPKVKSAKLLPLAKVIRGDFQAYQYIGDDFKVKVRAYIARFKTPLKDVVTEGDAVIHFRRGDFVKHSWLYNMCGSKHYLSGLRLLEERGKIGRVYVFSDDFSAIQEELRDIREHYDVVTVEGLSVLEDLCAMTSFRRYVLANSTFSWWGAFLSQYGEDVEVVVPDKPLSVSHPEDSFFPPHWIKI